MKFQSPLRDLPREVSVLVVASFFVAVGFGIMVPAIPLFARSFGVSNAAVGLIISLFAFTRFASGYSQDGSLIFLVSAQPLQLELH